MGGGGGGEETSNEEEEKEEEVWEKVWEGEIETLTASKQPVPRMTFPTPAGFIYLLFVLEIRWDSFDSSRCLTTV